MDFDMNWWGVLAFPLGTLICFGPVILAWAMSGRDETPQERNRRK